jgi:hypothetical protein
MTVHDLQRARVASHAPASQGSAVVQERREGAYVLAEVPELQAWTAARAASCLLEPRVGDRVWFVAEAGPSGQQRCWVTAVLERASAEAPARLSVDGAPELHLEAEVLRLRAEDKLEVQTDEVRVQGRLASVVLDECSSIVRSLFTHASRWTLVGKAIETLADRITSHSKTAQRTVESVDAVKAGTIDYRAEHSAQIGGEQAIVTGAEIVKVDGGQIHVG